MDTSTGTDRGADVLTGAPPPPQEVKVRTMRSDLASMAASGGGLPRYQNVKIASSAQSSGSPESSAQKTSLIVAIISIVAVIAILVGGYFLYQRFESRVQSQVPAGGQ